MFLSSKPRSRPGLRITHLSSNRSVYFHFIVLRWLSSIGSFARCIGKTSVVVINSPYPIFGFRISKWRINIKSPRTPAVPVPQLVQMIKRRLVTGLVHVCFSISCFVVTYIDAWLSNAIVYFRVHSTVTLIGCSYNRLSFKYTQ